MVPAECQTIPIRVLSLQFSDTFTVGRNYFDGPSRMSNHPHLDPFLAVFRHIDLLCGEKNLMVPVNLSELIRLGGFNSHHLVTSVN